MFRPGRIPMSAKEQEGVDALLERQGIDEKSYAAKAISFTRTDPDEKGTIQVEIEGDLWHVGKDGKARKA